MTSKPFKALIWKDNFKAVITFHIYNKCLLNYGLDG